MEAGVAETAKIISAGHDGGRLCPVRSPAARVSTCFRTIQEGQCLTAIQDPVWVSRSVWVVWYPSSRLSRCILHEDVVSWLDVGFHQGPALFRDPALLFFWKERDHYDVFVRDFSRPPASKPGWLVTIQRYQQPMLYNVLHGYIKQKFTNTLPHK